MTQSIDPRIQNLSYSSLLTLHSCPRRFQLDKLQAEVDYADDLSSSVTFAFGHIVGHGIQRAMECIPESQIIWEMFLMWEPDLWADNPKQVKSFWHGVLAVQKFIALRAAGYLKDYDLVIYNGKPACELSFRISFPDGFKYRGFVDVVLRHRVTGKVMVLELKTTASANLNAATYKNSAQAIGYSIVLDAIFPDLSSYEVLYLVYTTKTYEYNPLPFAKTFMQRALWIRELMLDIEVIKMYEDAGVYPMHGESCFDFYRECKYYNQCTLSTAALTDPYDPENAKVEEYQIEVTLSDLIEAQMRKAEAPVVLNSTAVSVKETSLPAIYDPKQLEGNL